MSAKRIIDTSFWTDDKVVDQFSTEDKLFFLYLMTNPHSKQLGIYAINKKYMAFELGFSVKEVEVLIDKFFHKYGIIAYSNETGEIAIKNYLRHSIVKGGKPVEDLLVKELSEVKDKALIEYVKSNIINDSNLNESVKKIITSLPSYNNKYINVNVNDNVNDVSYLESVHDTNHESYNESCNTQRKDKPSSLDEVINYMKEIGCPSPKEEADTFINHYSSNGWMVGKVHMKDWKAACRNWKKNVKPSSTPTPSPSIEQDMFYSLKEGQEIKTGVMSEW